MERFSNTPTREQKRNFKTPAAAIAVMASIFIQNQLPVMAQVKERPYQNNPNRSHLEAPNTSDLTNYILNYNKNPENKDELIPLGTVYENPKEEGSFLIDVERQQKVGIQGGVTQNTVVPDISNVNPNTNTNNNNVDPEINNSPSAASESNPNQTQDQDQNQSSVNNNNNTSEGGAGGQGGSVQNTINQNQAGPTVVNQPQVNNTNNNNPNFTNNPEIGVEVNQRTINEAPSPLTGTVGANINNLQQFQSNQPIGAYCPPNASGTIFEETNQTIPSTRYYTDVGVSRNKYGDGWAVDLRGGILWGGARGSTERKIDIECHQVPAPVTNIYHYHGGGVILPPQQPQQQYQEEIETELREDEDKEGGAKELKPDNKNMPVHNKSWDLLEQLKNSAPVQVEKPRGLN
ncbi:MAG: hypothetical protein AAGF07_01795 [Patescibacteria group bacterium]